MKFFKTSEYAIRVLAYIALADPKRVSAMSIHKELKIPYKYLGRLLTDLANHNFIKSERGKFGGYVMKKDLNKIYIADIIEAIEGEGNFSRCILGFENCSENSPCMMHKHWMPMQNTIEMKLRRLSIDELIKSNYTKL
ncbi:MAG: Rrf2 family transcriptional regulator [Calditrichaeota bacterium]|nr:Rrf2 family transcriptional regulator [Calditrichota bacterium]